MFLARLVKFLGLSNPLELCWPGGINEDPTVCLDEVRPTPKYVFKNNLSSTNSGSLRNYFERVSLIFAIFS